MGVQKKISDNSKQSGIVCAVKCCGNSRRKHTYLRFFRVPSSDSLIGRIWRVRCQISSKNFEKKYLYICEKHFSTEHLLKKTLRKGAVPTLNLGTQVHDHSRSSSNNADTNDDETEWEENEQSTHTSIDKKKSIQDMYDQTSSSGELGNPQAVSDIIDIGPIKIENDESEWFDSGEFRHSQEPASEFQLQDPQFADDPGRAATLTEPECEYFDDQECEEVNSDKAFLDSLRPYVKCLDMQQKMLLRMEIQRIVYNHAYPFS